MKKVLAAVVSLFMALVPVSTFACDITEQQIAEGASCSEPAASDVVIESSDIRFNAATETLNFDTKVKSSAFSASNELQDKSNVDGIKFSVGNKLVLSGEYEYGMNVGNKVEITGIYERDLFSIGNKTTIEQGAKIGRDVYVVGDSLFVKTNIPGSVFFAGNEVVLSDIKVAGDLVVAASKVRFEGNVEVAGQFKHNDDVNINGTAKFGSEEKYHLPTVKVNKMSVMIFSLLGGLVSVILGILIFKKFVAKVVEEKDMDAAKMLTTTGAGFVAVFAILVASVIMLATVVGAVFGIAILFGLISMLILSTSVTAVFLGEKLIKTNNMILNASIMIILLTALSALPYIGALIGFVASMFGFGLMYRILFKK